VSTKIQTMLIWWIWTGMRAMAVLLIARTIKIEFFFICTRKFLCCSQCWLLATTFCFLIFLI
jgi:hypothetical protein